MNTKPLKSHEVRKLFLEFFQSKAHSIIPSASLIPENDPTVLFTTSGMHPLVPYLMGEKHPEGVRLANVQKVVRTSAIDKVGGTSYCTFFELLGNWSLGDYFKKEAISYSWEFLTDERFLGLDKNKLFFTCFGGDEKFPEDSVSYKGWKDMGVDLSHLFYLPKRYNWKGPYGQTGLCGPNTKIFYDTGKLLCGSDCNPSCSCGKYLEIWDIVFMEYSKLSEGKFKPLTQKNVDTGMSLERITAILQGVESVYDTDAFMDIITCIIKLGNKSYKESQEVTRAFRIVADHIRCSTFILGDPRSVTPSNVDQGYILRRLIRRAIRFAMQLGMPENSLSQVAEVVVVQYGEFYTELTKNRTLILEELYREEQRFRRTLKNGMCEFDKIKSAYKEGDTIDGTTAFHLYETFGFPLEFTEELAKEYCFKVDTAGFQAAYMAHQKKSHAGAPQRFKNGLADTLEQTAKLHTATHLLQAALRKILGESIIQKGSNITAERLRFDFSFPRKMTKVELEQVENLVNTAIQSNLPITFDEITVDEAKEQGAIGLLESRNGNQVKVYTIGNISKEICSGPHAVNTSSLGKFKIIKEEASYNGVRRIKAVIEDT